MTDETALAVLPASALPTILGAPGAADILSGLAAKVAAHDPDVSTKGGEDATRSLAAQIRRDKASLIRMGKSLTEEWRKSTKAVNEECNLIEARMDDLWERVRAPLTAKEAREKARMQAHQTALEQIISLGVVSDGASPEQIRAQLSLLSDADQDGRDWQEFDTRSALAIRHAGETLRHALDAATKREAEAERARLQAEQDRIEREATIAREAAEQARVAAEARAAEEAAVAAREAREREEAAAQALAAAEAKAEADRVAGEQREADAQARIARMQEEKDAEDRRAEVARVSKHRRNLDAIGATREFLRRLTASEWQARIDMLTRAYDGYDWEEFAADGEATLVDTFAALNVLKRDAEEFEAEQTKSARAAAEEAAIQSERDRAALEAEHKRKADEARAADLDNRQAINRAALAALQPIISAVIEEPGVSLINDIGVAVLTAIAAGKIPNVIVKY